MKFRLAGLKPFNYHKSHVHDNGDYDLRELYHNPDHAGQVMNPMMTEPRTNWEEDRITTRNYGDVLNAKANKFGRIHKTIVDPVINLFG